MNNVPSDIAARELQLYADNTEPLHRMSMAIAKNLATKKAKGQYDREKALAAWEYLAKAAAQSYQKEFRDTTKWNVAFNKESRNDFNKAYRAWFEAEYASGAFETLLPGKYQKKATKKATSEAMKKLGEKRDGRGSYESARELGEVREWARARRSSTAKQKRAKVAKKRATAKRTARAHGRKTSWRSVPLFWLDTGRELNTGERLKALREYRQTGGMYLVVMAEPSGSNSPEEAERLSQEGPSADQINWAGFPGVR